MVKSKTTHSSKTPTKTTKSGQAQTVLNFSNTNEKKRKREIENESQEKKSKRQKLIDANTSIESIESHEVKKEMNGRNIKNEKVVKQKKEEKEKKEKKEVKKIDKDSNKKKSDTKLKEKQKPNLKKDKSNDIEDDGEHYIENEEELEKIVNSNASQAPRSGMWSDIYAPKSISQIIAHKTEIQVLNYWIQNFDSNFVHTSRKGTSKPADLKSQKQKRLYFECKKFRAVLLSGIAGIGKTSAAHLVCKENGFKVLEWNASDVRSKVKIQSEIAELTGNTTMESYFSEKKDTGKNVGLKKKIAIILDEVDGMSGGDRGGIQEIIKLIKDTKVPIICICNDVRKRNIVSLTKHCLLLPFSRPRKDIVQKYILKICELEHFKIDPDTLLQIIESLRNDIRCILNNLQFMSLNKLDTTKNAETIRKGTEQLNVFQVADSIFRMHDEERTINTIMNKYFFDPSLIPLFIQENYINMRRSAWTQEERAERIKEASDWISLGDLVESQLRRDQEWALAPFHSVCSTTAPTYYCHGGFEKLLPSDQHLIRFPSSLGKGSTSRKNESIVNLLKNNCSQHVPASNSDITLEYIPMWNSHISHELMREPPRIGDVISFMDEYGISRDDLELISELHTFKDILKVSNDFKKVNALTKRKLTASFKAASHQVSIASFQRRKKMNFSKESVLDEEASKNEIFQDETKEESDSDLDTNVVEKVDLTKTKTEKRKQSKK